MKNRGPISIRILIIIAIVALVAGVGVLTLQQHTNETPQDKEGTSIPYDEKCPYYEPNGFDYKICLNDLLEEQEEELFEQYDQAIATNPEMEDDLNKSKNLWLEHRNLLCEIENHNEGGTSHSVFVWFCKIEMTTDYSERIKSSFSNL